MRWLPALLAAAVPAFAEAPLSLTASDGSGLTLVALEADAVVEEPLAFTQLKLTFENPRDRVIEGQFRITLPRGAAVSRFAMKLDGRWQEGEVVERQAARRAYEDFLHRRQDPALLEQGAANEFTARVFPIPARGTKEVVLGFSQDLPREGARWVLPLKGLPQVRSLRATVTVNGAAQTLEKAGWVPDQDFAVAVPRSGRTGLRSGDLLVARVKPAAEAPPEPLDSVALLVDTSASRALGYPAQLELVKRLVAGLAAGRPGAQLAVAAFDQTLEVVHDGPASAFGEAGLKRLKDRKALGATDLQAALRWAAGAKKKRVVLVADGVATAGAAEADLLLAAVKGLEAAGVERLDAVGVGGIRDEDTLRKLATAGLPRDGAVLDGDSGAEEVLRRLGLATARGLTVGVEGARFVWPTRLDGVQPGDEVLVWAELPAGAPVKVSVGGRPMDVAKGLASIERPLLERAVAQARLAALVHRVDRVADGPKQKAQLRAQAVALSVKHRVLCPYTALLVLETEADYARFHLDRRALSDVVTVEGGRLRVVHRGPESVAVHPVAPPPTPAEDRNRSERPAETRARSGEAEAFDRPFEGAEEAKDESGAPDARPVRPGLMQKRLSTIQVIRGTSSGGGAHPPATAEPRAPSRPRPDASAPWGKRGSLPYEGQFKKVMDKLAAKDRGGALAEAWSWREEQPGDVLALVALGEALEASGELERAGRAYGSLVDLFPSRADLRRFAGGRLERLEGAAALALAADSYRKAVEQRPDHPSGQHLLAMALLKQGQAEQAFGVLEKALATGQGFGRFAGADQILREDLGLAAAAWAKAAPSASGAIADRRKAAGGVVEDQPSLRFVLSWETDANDVDFHIADAQGGHAYYGARTLPSGGTLYADITTGYGPECFTIRSPPAGRAHPYKLSAHYYARGPMGYGMGKVQLIRHDGAGGLAFEERPFVVMVDQAYVDLGRVEK